MIADAQGALADNGQSHLHPNHQRGEHIRHSMREGLPQRLEEGFRSSIFFRISASPFRSAKVGHGTRFMASTAASSSADKPCFSFLVDTPIYRPRILPDALTPGLTFLIGRSQRFKICREAARVLRKAAALPA